jgi:hypothetical protein
MKAIILAALLGTAALAQAAPNQAGAPANVDPQVVSGSRYKVNSWDFAVYKGKYQTADGGTIVVSQQNRKFYTQVNGQAPFEMVAAGPDSFVSRDGRTQVDFHQNANGDLMEVSLSGVAGSVAAVAAR